MRQAGLRLNLEELFEAEILIVNRNDPSLLFKYQSRERRSLEVKTVPRRKDCDAKSTPKTDQRSVRSEHALVSLDLLGLGTHFGGQVEGVLYHLRGFKYQGAFWVRRRWSEMI